MSEQIAHPSEEKLSDYNRGLLSPDEAVAIETHISDCEPCCETIVSLSSDDTFVGLLKDARQLPVDRAPDHDSGGARSSSSHGGIPPELAEHPRYEIVRLIGKGGMGDVYEAIHRKMERRVALKVINRALFQKTEAVNRFHREVKTAAQLSHPNIVTSHDADQAGEHHFMVMEYVDGVDLSHVVKDRGALPVAEACDYIRQAAIGLQHAHERGMVHRDIKPHNLMVTEEGTVKILDFGLASLAPEAIPASDAVASRSDLTAAGAIMGTPDFISPEQAEDARKVDIRSDIYSLGATLYYLLSGRVPFDDGSVMHKLKSHAQVEPAPLDSVRDDVPEELVAIASKMMAKDPGERYLTPSEVADALQSFLRTWQPGEENTPRQGASNGGNDSGSGGQKPLPDDSNPSWLPMVAKLLLYTSLLPIGLIFVNEFVPLPLFNGETDWFWYCLLTSIALSTIGGIVLGVHQGMSNIRDGQRKNGMTTGLIILLALSALGILNHMIAGNWHIEVTPQSDRMTLGTHPLTIVNTSGEKPFGGTHRTHKDRAAGITTHSFESANGRYKITLVDKVLTVNGEKYTLENPTDAIRIVDDRVEITRVMAGPENGEPSVRDNAQVSGAFPTLQIMRVEEESTNLGNDVKRTWKLQGRGLYMVSAQILHISNGERRTAYKTKLELNDAGHGDRQGQLVLHSEDRPNDQVALSLDLSFGNDHGESKSEPVSFAKGLGLSSISSQSLWDAQHIDQDDIAFLLTRAQYPSDEKDSTMHRMDDLGAMVRASKQGAEFLVVILHWEPVGNETLNSSGTSKANNHGLSGVEPALSRDRAENRIQHRGIDVADLEGELQQLQGEWETESLTESGKTLTAKDGFGGLLLQIKGDTFVIGERTTNGEESEVDTGRIEINSTSTPNTIDFIGRAQPDNRSIGIYEIKDGALRICLAERNATDGPRGARIPDVKPLKRPTTFDSPVGSNMMLIEFQRTQPDVNPEQQTRNVLDTTYISNDTVGLLVAHPQRILSGKSKVKEELHQMFAKVAKSEGLDVRNLSQIAVQLGPPPLSSRPIRNLFDEQLWTVILRFDEPLDGEAYIEKYAQGYRKAKHKHGAYYKHDSRMEMWFPDDRTLILAAERRILSLIDDPEGKGPMALRMRRADPTADLLLEIDVRQAGPLLLESLPSESQTPEIFAVIEQTVQKLKRITLTAQQSSDTPIEARFHAVDAEQADELHAQAVVWLETAKDRWSKLRDLIRERPADEDTTPPNRRALALAFADEIDSVLPSLRSTVDEDQLLVRLEQEGGVDLATLLAFFLLID